MAKYLSRAKRLDQAMAPMGDSQTIVEGILEVMENAEVPRWELLTGAADTIEGGKSEVECLKEELEGWYDNLPENFQNGMKGDELQEAIDALDTLVESMDEAISDIGDIVATAEKSAKGKEPMDLEETMDTLRSIIEKIEEFSCPDVMFPGMY